jgi:hypothetical protein
MPWHDKLPVCDWVVEAVIATYAAVHHSARPTVDAFRNLAVQLS